MTDHLARASQLHPGLSPSVAQFAKHWTIAQDLLREADAAGAATDPIVDVLDATALALGEAEARTWADVLFQLDCALDLMGVPEGGPVPALPLVERAQAALVLSARGAAARLAHAG